MTALADYNPILTVALPGTELNKPKGLVVVVGPNSSGKTLFLRDIEGAVVGIGQRPIVCSGIRLEKPAGTFDQFVERMCADRLVKPNGDELAVITPYYGGWGMANQSNKRQTLSQMFQSFDSANEKPNLGFFDWIGRALLTSLFLNNRLMLHIPQGRFDISSTVTVFYPSGS